MKMSRKIRMQDVLAILKANGGEMSFMDLLGAMSEKWAITKATFWSYLEALKAEGYIEYPNFYHDIGGPKFNVKLVESTR